jgi:hypothetical protein
MVGSQDSGGVSLPQGRKKDSLAQPNQESQNLVDADSELTHVSESIDEFVSVSA